MSKWISVKDKMPQSGVEVIVFSRKKGIDFTHYHADLECWDNYDSISHWQPLPEPPEKPED